MDPLKELNKGTFFYIAAAGIFLIIISPAFLSEGMFMDGLMYATMSKNLANGMGTFWQPHFSEIIFPSFINHPPLAIGIESIFFRILGDIRIVEKLYSVFAILITAVLIVTIWKSLGKKSPFGWLPLLFWIAMPSVTWAATNNMLENTMGTFICLSVLFYVRSLSSNRFIFLLLSGIMLSLGFLTKGFVTFFPLSFPFFYWLFERKTKLWSVVADTLVIISTSLMVLFLLYLTVPQYRETLPGYLGVTFDLVGGAATKSSRFFILYQLLMELLPVFGIILAVLAWSRFKKFDLYRMKPDLNAAAAFFCLGLSGVLPIMITRVQSGYYLLTSLPFFAISLSVLISTLVETIIIRINFQSTQYKIFKVTSMLLLVTGIALSAHFSGHVSRNKDMINDMKVISSELAEKSTINILPEMWTNWSLHTYYARYKNISLDPDLNNRHSFLLINKSLCSDTIARTYDRLQLNTREFDLFSRKP